MMADVPMADVPDPPRPSYKDFDETWSRTKPRMIESMTAFENIRTQTEHQSLQSPSKFNGIFLDGLQKRANDNIAEVEDCLSTLKLSIVASEETYRKANQANSDASQTAIREANEAAQKAIQEADRRKDEYDAKLAEHDNQRKAEEESYRARTSEAEQKTAENQKILDEKLEEVRKAEEQTSEKRESYETLMKTVEETSKKDVERLREEVKTLREVHQSFQDSKLLWEQKYNDLESTLKEERRDSDQLKATIEAKSSGDYQEALLKAREIQGRQAGRQEAETAHRTELETLRRESEAAKQGLQNALDRETERGIAMERANAIDIIELNRADSNSKMNLDILKNTNSRLKETSALDKELIKVLRAEIAQLQNIAYKTNVDHTSQLERHGIRVEHDCLEIHQQDLNTLYKTMEKNFNETNAKYAQHASAHNKEWFKTANHFADFIEGISTRVDDISEHVKNNPTAEAISNIKEVKRHGVDELNKLSTILSPIAESIDGNHKWAQHLFLTQATILENVNKTFNTLKDELDQEKQLHQNEVNIATNEFPRLKDDFKRLQEQNTALIGERDRLSTQVPPLVEEAERLRSALLDVHDEKNELERILSELKQKILESDNEIVMQGEALHEANTKVARLQKDLDECREHLENRQQPDVTEASRLHAENLNNKTRDLNYKLSTLGRSLENARKERDHIQDRLRDRENYFTNELRRLADSQRADLSTIRILQEQLREAEKSKLIFVKFSEDLTKNQEKHEEIRENWERDKWHINLDKSRLEAQVDRLVLSNARLESQLDECLAHKSSEAQEQTDNPDDSDDDSDHDSDDDQGLVRREDLLTHHQQPPPEQPSGEQHSHEPTSHEQTQEVPQGSISASALKTPDRALFEVEDTVSPTGLAEAGSTQENVGVVFGETQDTRQDSQATTESTSRGRRVVSALKNTLTRRVSQRTPEQPEQGPPTKKWQRGFSRGRKQRTTLTGKTFVSPEEPLDHEDDQQPLGVPAMTASQRDARGFQLTEDRPGVHASTSTFPDTSQPSTVPGPQVLTFALPSTAYPGTNPRVHASTSALPGSVYPGAIPRVHASTSALPSTVSPGTNPEEGNIGTAMDPFTQTTQPQREIEAEHRVQRQPIQESIEDLPFRNLRQPASSRTVRSQSQQATMITVPQISRPPRAQSELLQEMSRRDYLDWYSREREQSVLHPESVTHISTAGVRVPPVLVQPTPVLNKSAVIARVLANQQPGGAWLTDPMQGKNPFNTTETLYEEEQRIYDLIVKPKQWNIDLDLQLRAELRKRKKPKMVAKYLNRNTAGVSATDASRRFPGRCLLSNSFTDSAVAPDDAKYMAKDCRAEHDGSACLFTDYLHTSLNPVLGLTKKTKNNLDKVFENTKYVGHEGKRYLLYQRFTQEDMDEAAASLKAEIANKTGARNKQDESETHGGQAQVEVGARTTEEQEEISTHDDQAQGGGEVDEGGEEAVVSQQADTVEQEESAEASDDEMLLDEFN